MPATVNPGLYYGGTVSLSCTGAPATLACTFAPASLTFTPTGSAAQTTTLNLTAAPGSARFRPLFGSHGSTTFAAMLGLPGMILVMIRRHKAALPSNLRSLLTLLLLFAATLGFLAASGCGTTRPPPSTSNTIDLVLNANDGNSTHSFAVIVTITQ